MKEKNGNIKIQIKQFLWPDCKACGGKCKAAKAIEFCKESQLGITRQEAIEVMAKAIRNWEFPYSPRQIGWEDLSEDTKNDYKNMAQSALNALLEGAKK